YIFSLLSPLLRTIHVFALVTVCQQWTEQRGEAKKAKKQTQKNLKWIFLLLTLFLLFLVKVKSMFAFVVLLHLERTLFFDCNRHRSMFRKQKHWKLNTPDSSLSCVATIRGILSQLQDIPKNLRQQ